MVIYQRIRELSVRNALVQRLVSLRNDRVARESERLVVIEGKKQIDEIARRTQIEHLIVRNDQNAAQLIESWTKQPRHVFTASAKVFDKISGLVSTEGILATVPLPQTQSLSALQWILVLDRLNDPGNVGTLVRTAAALGWHGVFFLQPACDPFNHKACSASRGAIFGLPFDQGDLNKLQSSLIHPNQQVWFAEPPSSTETRSQQLTINSSMQQILILSNESHGISQDLRSSVSGQSVQIPMNPTFDIGSLNVAVAGGILMYKLKHLSQQEPK